MSERARHPRHAALQAQVIDALRLQTMGWTNHVVVGPVNIGTPDDYRIPAAAIISPSVLDDESAFVSTAELVVEVGPADDAKRAFYQKAGVSELLTVEESLPGLASDGPFVTVVSLTSDEVGFSRVLGVFSETLTQDFRSLRRP